MSGKIVRDPYLLELSSLDFVETVERDLPKFNLQRKVLLNDCFFYPK